MNLEKAEKIIEGELGTNEDTCNKPIYGDQNLHVALLSRKLKVFSKILPISKLK